MYGRLAIRRMRLPRRAMPVRRILLRSQCTLQTRNFLINLAMPTTYIRSAGMAELADAADSKSADLRVMGVRPPLPAPMPTQRKLDSAPKRLSQDLIVRLKADHRVSQFFHIQITQHRVIVAGVVERSIRERSGVRSL